MKGEGVAFLRSWSDLSSQGWRGAQAKVECIIVMLFRHALSHATTIARSVVARPAAVPLLHSHVDHVKLMSSSASTFAGSSSSSHTIAPDVASAILHGAADAIIQVSKEDEVLFWNSGAQETFGYSAAEAVGQSLTDLIVPEKHKQMHSSGFAKVMAGEPSKYGRRDLLRVPALCKDGSRLAVEFTLLVLPDEHGAPSSSVAIMRDVSVMSGTIRKLRNRIAKLEHDGRDRND